MRNLCFSAAVLVATLAIAHPASANAQSTTVTSNPTAAPIESSIPGMEATATASPIGGMQSETTTGIGATSGAATSSGGGGRWGWLGLLGLLGLFGLRGGATTATTYEDRR